MEDSLADRFQRLAVDVVHVIPLRMPIFGKSFLSIWIVVDNVYARDPETTDDVLVVVGDGASVGIDEIFSITEITGGAPHHLNDGCRGTDGLVFLEEGRAAPADHVEQDAILRPVVRDVRIACPKLRTEAPGVRFVVVDKFRRAIILGVKENNVDSNAWILGLELAGDLQKSADAACPVIGPIEGLAVVRRIRIMIRVGATVPMCEEKDAFVPVGIVAADDIVAAESCAVVGGQVGLLDECLSPESFQLARQVVGAGLVRFGIGYSRAESDLFFDISVGAVGVKLGHVGSGSRFGGRDCRHVVVVCVLLSAGEERQAQEYDREF